MLAACRRAVATQRVELKNLRVEVTALRAEIARYNADEERAFDAGWRACAQRLIHLLHEAPRTTYLDQDVEAAVLRKEPT